MTSQRGNHTVTTRLEHTAAARAALDWVDEHDDLPIPYLRVQTTQPPRLSWHVQDETVDAQRELLYDLTRVLQPGAWMLRSYDTSTWMTCEVHGVEFTVFVDPNGPRATTTDEFLDGFPVLVDP
jgi:hypothetical protein